jgi:hypothetical protein
VVPCASDRGRPARCSRAAISLAPLDIWTASAVTHPRIRPATKANRRRCPPAASDSTRAATIRANHTLPRAVRARHPTHANPRPGRSPAPSQHSSQRCTPLHLAARSTQPAARSSPTRLSRQSPLLWQALKQRVARSRNTNPYRLPARPIIHRAHPGRRTARP